MCHPQSPEFRFCFLSLGGSSDGSCCMWHVCLHSAGKQGGVFVPSMVHIVRHTAPGVTNFNTGYVAVAAVAATGPEIEYLILAFVAL